MEEPCIDKYAFILCSPLINLLELHSKFIVCMGRIPERKKELVAFIENADIELTIKAQKVNLLKRITSLTGYYIFIQLSTYTFLGIIFADKYLKRVAEDPSAVKGDDPMDLTDIKEVFVHTCSIRFTIAIRYQQQKNT